MTAVAKKTDGTELVLIKADTTTPCLKVLDRAAISIKAGTIFNGMRFETDTPVVIDVPLEPGADYGIVVSDGTVGYARLQSGEIADDVLGGFHFAPGGNATARAGGDDVPVINPFSLWDIDFRPACPDPRGMVCVDGPRGKFWCDIYLLGVNHATEGTSRFGVRIADGRDLPFADDGKKVKRFDYQAAVAAMAQHGKGLLACDEFFIAAHGVTERTAHDGDPETTQCDPARTSRYGLMQATGNMWVWGHDGDPDEPRPSIFGGSWVDGGDAGSRCASLGSGPDNSNDNLGARGRCDHLQLG